jgi:hypothetical protein
MRGLMIALAAAGAFASAPAAAQSNILNADVQQRVGADLAQTFQELSNNAGPLWIGYAVPARDADWNACCHDSGVERGGCGRCALEGARAAAPAIPSDRAQRPPVALEGGELVVLVRIADRQVDQVRAFSRNCDVDAGGRRVYWLTDVQPAASVALLNRIADARSGSGKNRIAGGAIMAIAAHADPAADRALERLIAPDRPIEVRKQAAFWSGNSRGRSGFELVQKTLTGDADDEFRRHAVFAISQSREPDAADALIQLARRDASPDVRGQALFWLAHKAGRKAAGAISESIENDPDTEVKERAVFALSQLPANEGVPRLIEIARTNRNLHVRKRAMFWLGQTRDPRALKFFEEILSK